MVDTLSQIRHLMVRMMGVVALVVGGLALWSYLAPLDGAIVAVGTVAVDGNVKKIQHVTGGTIAEIAVEEGQQVKAGDILLRLSDSVTRVNLAVIVNELTALRIRHARLSAERDGALAFQLPPDLKKNEDPETQKIWMGEQSLFAARVSARSGQKQQLMERISQSREEISGLEEQKRALLGQLVFARDDRDAIETLVVNKFVTRTRRSELHRDVFRLEGSVGELRARIAQNHGKIAEIEVQMAQLDKDNVSEIARETRDVEIRIHELAEKRHAAEDALRRIEIRAPVSGIVHGLSIHTVDGVVSPGETMMTLVPDPPVLILDVRVATTERDLLHVGQKTRIRFSGLNQRTTPEIEGTLFRVAEAATTEQQTGVAYYVVGVRMAEADLKKLGNIRLVPGMPAEIFILTGERTLFAYLLKPVLDQMAKALRDGR